ncbi:MAG: type I DNA topoisomerase [Erysipelotrichaceae bacterium]|nr:type I DNA topoisomerase [Erysipelotrichaceae bacterium]
MEKSLIIVESPNKCATIERYLGQDAFTVVASKGHITELATVGKFGLGVNLETFQGIHIVDPKKAEIVKQLKKTVKNYQNIYLATDPDREGEAISYHLMQELSLDRNTPRIVFHEITRDAIMMAIEEKRTIDMDLVNSQEARRVLDRLIGFRLSKLLEAKTHTPSAGRVQSATLKIVTDREKEIRAFQKQFSYSLELKIRVNDQIYVLKITKFKGKAFKNLEQNQLLKDLLTTLLSGTKKLIVSSIKTRSVDEESKPPFITSTLQKSASKLFGFSPEKTQSIAQKLFEKGYITYIRTDSTNLSQDFVRRATSYIEQRFGKEYLGKVKIGAKVKGAQEAHEAIRPTANHQNPTSVKTSLSSEEYKIYTIIYSRAIQSLMKPIKYLVTTVTFNDEFQNEYVLEGKEMTFDGYHRHRQEEKLYDDRDTEEKQPHQLPAFKQNDTFYLESGEVVEHVSKPPAAFTEASLIEAMEKAGIGRPSTYATTLKTLKQRKYVVVKDKKLVPTSEGETNVAYLEANFPNLVDSKYTSKMEDELDGIAEGKLDRKELLKDFWERFEPRIQEKFKEQVTAQYVGRTCPKCGGELVYKYSKNGKFIGCSNYPTCDYVEALNLTGEPCPVCGKSLKKKEGKYKKSGDFVYCSGYPHCRYSYNTKDGKPVILETKCPECGHVLLEKKDYLGNKTISCSACQYEVGKVKPTPVKKCPECGGDLYLKVSTKKTPSRKFLGCSNFPKCRHIEPIDDK